MRNEPGFLGLCQLLRYPHLTQTFIRRPSGVQIGHFLLDLRLVGGEFLHMLFEPRDLYVEVQRLTFLGRLAAATFVDSRYLGFFRHLRGIICDRLLLPPRSALYSSRLPS